MVAGGRVILERQVLYHLSNRGNWKNFRSLPEGRMGEPRTRRKGLAWGVNLVSSQESPAEQFGSLAAGAHQHISEE